MPPTQRLPDAVDRTQLPDGIRRLVPVLACESSHATPSGHFGVRQARRRLLPPLACCAMCAKAALHTNLALVLAAVKWFRRVPHIFRRQTARYSPEPTTAPTALHRRAASHPRVSGVSSCARRQELHREPTTSRVRLPCIPPLLAESPGARPAAAAPPVATTSRAAPARSRGGRHPKPVYRRAARTFVFAASYAAQRMRLQRLLTADPQGWLPLAQRARYPE